MKNVVILGAYVEGERNLMNKRGELGQCVVIDIPVYEGMPSHYKNKIKDKFKMYSNYGVDGKDEYVKGTFIEKNITGIEDVMDFINRRKLVTDLGMRVVYDILLEGQEEVMFEEGKPGERKQKEVLTEQEELKIRKIDEVIKNMSKNHREIQENR